MSKQIYSSKIRNINVYLIVFICCSRYLRMQQILLNGDMVSTALSDSKKKECWIPETIHNQQIFLSLKEKVWNRRWAVFFYSNIESGFCKGIVNVSGLSDFMNTIQFLVIWGCTSCTQDPSAFISHRFKWKQKQQLCNIKFESNVKDRCDNDKLVNVHSLWK